MRIRIYTDNKDESETLKFIVNLLSMFGFKTNLHGVGEISGDEHAYMDDRDRLSA